MEAKDILDAKGTKLMKAMGIIEDMRKKSEKHTTDATGNPSSANITHGSFNLIPGSPEKIQEFEEDKRKLLKQVKVERGDKDKVLEEIKKKRGSYASRWRL